MSEYTVKANQFLRKNNIVFTQKEPSWDYKCEWDEQQPYGHAMSLCRFINKTTGKSMTVRFFNSLMESGKRVTAYDVLACLTKNDVGTFEQFCWEFGYDTDSRRAERTYKACKKEYTNVTRVFGNCIDELMEIV